MQRVARQVARDIASASAGAIVAGAALDSDAAAPRGAELVARVVSLLAGAIGPEVRTGKAPTTLEAARADASSAAALVFVKVQVAGGELRVSADVFPIARNVWDRARNPSPGPAAHGFGSARIDAEVRSYLAPIPLVASETLKAPVPAPAIQALLCADVDGDDALELVAASGRDVLLGRFRNKRFDVMRKAAWESFSPIAPVPWRQALMSMAMSARGGFDLGSTDRAHAVRLDGQLSLQDAFGGFPVPVPGGAVCAQREIGELSKELSPCTKQSAPSPWPDIGFAFDGSAAASVVRADGRVDGVFAARRVSDSTAVLRDLQGHTANVPNVGAQLAVADLDLDGEPELLASRNVLDPSQDALVVRTWRQDGAVQERWSLPVPQGISAIAPCPPEGPGMRPIAVATPTELWLIR